MLTSTCICWHKHAYVPCYLCIRATSLVQKCLLIAQMSHDCTCLIWFIHTCHMIAPCVSHHAITFSIDMSHTRLHFWMIRKLTNSFWCRMTQVGRCYQPRWPLRLALRIVDCIDSTMWYLPLWILVIPTSIVLYVMPTSTMWCLPQLCDTYLNYVMPTSMNTWVMSCTIRHRASHLYSEHSEHQRWLESTESTKESSVSPTVAWVLVGLTLPKRVASAPQGLMRLTRLMTDSGSAWGTPTVQGRQCKVCKKDKRRGRGEHRRWSTLEIIGDNKDSQYTNASRLTSLPCPKILGLLS